MRDIVKLGMQPWEIMLMIESEWRDRLAAALAAEREACAKACDEAVKDAGTDWENGFNHACGDLADAIRGRGET